MLRAYIEDYIQNLQTLKVQHSNNQDLLDAAEDKWGTEDARFMILQERLKQQRWTSKSGPPNPEVPKSEDEQNEPITWFPDIFQDLLKGTADDKALVKEAEKKWGQGSYEYLVVKQGLNLDWKPSASSLADNSVPKLSVFQRLTRFFRG